MLLASKIYNWAIRRITKNNQELESLGKQQTHIAALKDESFLIPCSTYIGVNGLGLISSIANLSKFLFLLTMTSNFEEVNLNLRESLHCWEWNRSLVADSMLIIIVSSTTRKLRRAPSIALKFSVNTKWAFCFSGNLGYASSVSEMLPSLPTEETSTKVWKFTSVRVKW